MMNHMLLGSTAELKKVKSVQFSVLSPDELEAMSVAEITTERTFENSKPIMGGLSDPRLGTIDKDRLCVTCDCRHTDCPGHFGHIKLVKPVFHIGFMHNVIKVLRCICVHCSKLLIDDSEPRYKTIQKMTSSQSRLREILKLASKRRFCDAGETEVAEENPNDADPFGNTKKKKVGHGGCGNPQPVFSKDGLEINAEYRQEGLDDSIDRKQKFSAEKVYNIFKHISEADCKMMGFDCINSRPDWLLCTVFPVPPPHVRPSVSRGADARSEDDLTHKLADIIKANNQLRQQEINGAPSHFIQEYTALLQYHVATFVDNEIAGLPTSRQRGGRPLKSVRQRLKGKEGRIRGNLMGKRVDFSARTVITPDPNLSIDQVGVPRSIASNLTFPEVVTPFNIDRLRALVQNGPDIYPGAKYIVRNDGTRVNLDYAPAEKKHLEYGYVVERHIQDGDPVLFNRQPSLHKMSMMGHRIKIMPYSTFRLNLSVTTPYNADFDGDEMNLHVPQSLLTKAELLEIMMVPRQIVSPQGNRPVMGIVQDSLLGTSKMTRRDTFLERDFFFGCIMMLQDFDGRIPIPAILKAPNRSKNRPIWTGKQVFSMIIPKVNYSGKSNADDKLDGEDPSPSNPKTWWMDTKFPYSDTKVFVSQGELLTGICDKTAVGNKAGSLIHIIWMEHGHRYAQKFFDQIQKITNYWLLNTGFSIGISDSIADENTMKDIVLIVQKAKDKVKELVFQAQAGELLPTPGRTMAESFEASVNTELNKAREEAGKKGTANLTHHNRFRAMVVAGSKGSELNIAQVTACVGQQNVEGKRIPFGFRNRSLPHFTQFDHGPESRGFVENSYLRGLTPQEFFFHTMGGREGVIDTACKTAETGYIQRRLIKGMEDCQVRYDGTVRDSQGNILQFLYGEDGMDGCRVEQGDLETIQHGDRKMESIYKYELREQPDGSIGIKADFGANYMDPIIADDFKTNPAKCLVLMDEYEQLLRDRDALRAERPNFESKVYMPLNLPRLILNAQRLYGIPRITTLDPSVVVNKVKALCDRLVVIKGIDPLSVEAQSNATLLLQSHIRSLLASKRVLREHKLDPQAFDFLLAEVEERFKLAMCTPGEMVGSIAAQSIGEPATQMTLNTFHNAGVSAKNVTLGVPRLREIINVAKKIKTPLTTIFLEDNMSGSEDLAKSVADKIEFTNMHSITIKSEIYYDPSSDVIPDDAEMIELHMIHQPENYEETISPWVLRFELDKPSVVSKGLTPEAIARRIEEVYAGDLEVISSIANEPRYFLRIRIRNRDEANKRAEEGDAEGGDDEALDMEQHVEFLRKVENQLLTRMHLLGISGITKVFHNNRDHKKYRIDPVTKEATTEAMWVLDAEGLNLLEVMGFDHVDSKRCFSNSLEESIMVLGIEGCRNVLLKELRAVIEFDNSYVNYRHLAMLCDIMTNRGHLMAITRHGINRSDSGPLMRCSFEETVEILMDAAAFSEPDSVKGVSSNVMLGNLASIGTGCFDLLLDTELCRLAVPQEMFNLVTSGPGGAPDYMGGAATPAYGYMGTPSNQTPRYDGQSPLYPGYIAGGATPFTSAMSPMISSPWNSGMSPSRSPFVGGFSPAHMSPFSPSHGSPSHQMGGGFSPMSPSAVSHSPTSPYRTVSSPSYMPSAQGHYSPTSPAYSPQSPSYSPTSPAHSASSGSHGSSSANYSPQSPRYSPSSPRYSSSGASPNSANGYSPASPAYSPASPAYSPNGSNMASNSSQSYSPQSPQYSPANQYSPSSPKYSPGSYSPSSPKYSPSSPSYNPTASGGHSNSSASYSPSSPQYSPQS